MSTPTILKEDSKIVDILRRNGVRHGLVFKDLISKVTKFKHIYDLSSKFNVFFLLLNLSIQLMIKHQKLISIYSIMTKITHTTINTRFMQVAPITK